MKNSTNVAAKGMSRRSFLAGAGVFAASAGAMLAGCAPESQSEQAAEPAQEAGEVSSEAAAAPENDIWAIKELGEPDEVISADVAIVGGGGTGLAAAIQAVDLGLNPVVIEREPAYGGSFVGTEGMTALETKYTRDNPPYLASAYYPDQPYGVKNAMNTCLNYHHWIPQHKLYENFFGQTAETIDWLEGHGQKFAEVIGIGAGPKIWHVYDKGDHGSTPGFEFMRTFSEEADRLGVTARFNTFARRVIIEDGKVAGLLCEGTDGSVLKVGAPVVMIGSGGYANNPEFLYGVSETKNENIQAMGMPIREGDGIKMAKAAGAAMAEGLGTVMWCGPVPIGAITASWTIDAYTAGVQPTLWLNQDGERFCKEDLWIDDFSAAGIQVRNQHKTYVLFTEADMLDWEANGPWGQCFSFGMPGTPLAEAREVLEPAAGVHIGDDLAALCAEVGLDAAAVQATVDRYNELCANAAGKDANDVSADEDFGKQAQYMHPVASGPYWLIETADGYYTTCGGIKVNEKVQVLNEDGEVIPGLYAGGSDAGGLYGDSYDVKFAPGSQAAWAMNSGRLAMKDAKEYLGK